MGRAQSWNAWLVRAAVVTATCLCLGAMAAGADVGRNDGVPALTPEERQWLADHPVLRLGSVPDWAPISMFDERHELSGIAADYVRILERRLGIRFQARTGLAWKDVLEMGRKRELDVIGLLGRTEARDSYLEFADVLVDLPYVIIVRGDRRGIERVEDLRGVTVSVSENFVAHEWLRETHPEISLLPKRDTALALEAVSVGEAQAFVGDVATAGYQISQRGLTNLKVAGETGYVNQLRFAVREDWPELVGILNKALATVSPAERKEIWDRWVSLKPYGFDPRILYGLLAAMVALILAILLISNRRLRMAHAVVTERTRQLDEKVDELAETAEFARQIIASAQEGIIVYGTDLRYRAWNRYMEDLTGCKAEEVLGRQPTEVFPFLESTGVMGALRRSMQGEAPTTSEFAFHLPSGHSGWVVNTTGPLLDANGGVIGAIGCVRDITERKRVEEALRDSENRWKFAIEGAGDGLWDWNIQTGKAFYSSRYKEMLGYGDAEIGDSADEWSKRIHPDDAPRVFEIIQPYLEGKHGTATVEFRMACKDETWKWILGRGMVVSRDHDGKALRMIGTNTDITAQKQAEERINTLAFYDQLTGLPNRRLLLDRLTLAMAATERNGMHGALLFIDLDNFKILNDTRGHEVGDHLLKQVAERLRSNIRGEDTAARQGGDEFVVLLSDLGRQETEAALIIEGFANKLLAELNRNYEFDGLTHHSTASIGVALFKGQSTSIDELMKEADLAMYRAKAAGRSAVRFFDPTLGAAVKARADLEADLRCALAEKQFLLHYQPQVLSDGRVTGAEVLVRWLHPQRGLVLPADFIPLAEDTHLILPLGLWVLETACERIAEWSGNPRLAGLSIAVNVSAKQFLQPEFVDQVSSVLKRCGADPCRLKLELTESLLLRDVEGIIEKMHRLKSLGIGFSLDDFGTGYSSLSYLRRLPLDQLKIDQSFVRDVLADPNDAAIAKTIVALAQSLGLAVIAEGVETEAQRAFLAASGCYTYQGYLFSQPVPVEEFERCVGANPGNTPP